jgi:hypothetical protein
VTQQAVQNLVESMEAEMAKKKRDPLGDFAEDVGRLLGTTERKASEWLSQRTVVARKLAAVRDEAQALLSKLNAGDVQLPGKSPRAGGAKKRTKRSGRTSTAAQRGEEAAPVKAPRTAHKRKPAKKKARKTHL